MPPPVEPPLSTTHEARFQTRGWTGSDIFTSAKETTSTFIQSHRALPTITKQDRVELQFRAFLKLVKAENRWEEYQLPAEEVLFTSDAPLFSLETLIAFFNYVCLSSQGQLSSTITVKTLEGIVSLFLGLTTRKTHKSYPHVITCQLFAYATGEAVQKFGLSRETRPKPVADLVDISIVLGQLWSPEHPIQNTRLRRQIGASINYMSRAASRPGSYLESSAYANTNEAATWAAAQFTILTPSCPHPWSLDDTDLLVPRLQSGRNILVLRFKSTLLKGKRNTSQYIAFAFYPEPITSETEPFVGPGFCVVTDFLLMAMEDGVFMSVKTWDDLHLLMSSATSPIELQIDPAKAQLPIFRAYVPGTHDISPNKAMKYSTLYTQMVKLGNLCGFQQKLTPYCCRRMAAGNMDGRGDVSESEKRRVMTHDVNSKIFEKYLSSLITLDLSAIAAGKEQNRDKIKLIGRMSLMADNQAPISVSPERMRKIMELPEIKDLIAIQDAARVACYAKYPTLSAAKDSPEGVAYKKAYTHVKSALLRHERHALAEERTTWFQSKDGRVLEAAKQKAAAKDVQQDINDAAIVDAEQAMVSLLPDDHDENIELLDLKERLKEVDVDINNLTMEDLCRLVQDGGYETAMQLQAQHLNELAKDEEDKGGNEEEDWVPASGFSNSSVVLESGYDSKYHLPPDLARKMTFGGFPDDGSLDAQFHVWTTLAKLPLKPVARRTEMSTTCYKGEEPTKEGFCHNRECAEDLTDMARSLRTQHLHACARKIHQARSDILMQQRITLPKRCPVESCEDSLRNFSSPDVYNHILRHHRKNLLLCRIANCPSPHLSDDEDIYLHWEEEHQLPGSKTGFLIFDYFCHTWFYTRVEFDEHMQSHLDLDWLPKMRSDDPNDDEEYEWEDVQYGTVTNTGLVLRPGICPACVWNEDLPASVRLHQHTGGNLPMHVVNAHHNDWATLVLDDNELLPCPCKACEHSRIPTFDLLDLYNHLISVHEIPMGGKRSKSTDGTLLNLSTLKDLKLPSNKKDGIFIGVNDKRSDSDADTEVRMVPAKRPAPRRIVASDEEDDDVVMEHSTSEDDITLSFATLLSKESTLVSDTSPRSQAIGRLLDFAKEKDGKTINKQLVTRNVHTA